MSGTLICVMRLPPNIAKIFSHDITKRLALPNISISHSALYPYSHSLTFRFQTWSLFDILYFSAIHFFWQYPISIRFRIVHNLLICINIVLWNQFSCSLVYIEVDDTRLAFLCLSLLPVFCSHLKLIRHICSSKVKWVGVSNAYIAPTLLTFFPSIYRHLTYADVFWHTPQLM